MLIYFLSAKDTSFLHDNGMPLASDLTHGGGHYHCTTFGTTNSPPARC